MTKGLSGEIDLITARPVKRILINNFSFLFPSDDNWKILASLANDQAHPPIQEIKWSAV